MRGKSNPLKEIKEVVKSKEAKKQEKKIEKIEQAVEDTAKKVEEVKKPEPPTGLDPKFKSNAEKTQAFYESFWEVLPNMSSIFKKIKTRTIKANS